MVQDFQDQLENDHLQITASLDQMQRQIDSRPSALRIFSRLLLDHLEAMETMSPSLSRYIVYPSITQHQQDHGDHARQILTQLDRLAPENLEFDAVLQDLIDICMDQIDWESQILVPALAVLPRSRRLILSHAFQEAHLHSPISQPSTA